MLLTRRHAKHMQNYEYLNWARIIHGFKKRTRIGKCDEVIKYNTSKMVMNTEANMVSKTDMCSKYNVITETRESISFL